MTFDLGIFLGLIAVAVAVFFGLWPFRKDVNEKLSDIRTKLMTMGITLDNAWDLLRMHFLKEAGTVERDSSNLGKIKITAHPGGDATIYDIDVQKPVLEQGLICKTIKATGLEDVELKLFNDELVKVGTPTPTRARITLPCTDAQKCTEYMSIFLKWLDSTYYDVLPKIKDFEEPIQI